MRSTISELEFQFALMMGYYSSFKRSDDFKLFLPTQQEEGAGDAADWVFGDKKSVCLYLQFKRSKLVAPNSPTRTERELLINQFNQGKPNEDQIIDDQEIYFFEPYKKKKYRQHNHLFDKRLEGNIGCYVAPIFNKRSVLYEKFKDWLFNESPSDTTAHTLINTQQNITPSLIKLGSFNDVLYILPHDRINDKNQHRYCFSKNRKVSYHSEPTLVSEGVYDTKEIFIRAGNMLDSGDSKLMLEHADSQLEDLKLIGTKDYRKYIIDDLLGNLKEDKENPILSLERLRSKGKILKFITTTASLYKEVLNIQPIYFSKKNETDE